MFMSRWLYLAGMTAAGNSEWFDEDFCGGAKSISIAGSSIMLLLAEAWAEDFREYLCPDTTTTVESGGSSSGAGRVCANSAKGTR